MVKNARKRYMAVILSLAMMVSLLPALALPALAAGDVWDGTSVATSFAGGNGEKDTPYQIATAAQLMYMAQLINSIDAVSGTCKSYQNKYYILTDDIDLSAGQWTPIAQIYGSYDTSFVGSFDGQGHKITFKLDATDTSMRTAGLFGYLGVGGAVKNLTVCGNINIENNTDSIRAGGVAGYNEGTISNCISSANVMGTETYNIDDHPTRTVNVPYISVGGIVGNNCGSVMNCTSTGNVTGVMTVNPKHVDVSSSGSNGYVGGITGNNDANAVIADCHSTGNVTGNSEADYGYSWCYVGGIIGRTPCTTGGQISGCDSSGQIACTATAKDGEACAYAGGFAGILFELGLTIKNSSSTCTVSGSASSAGEDDANAYIGGFVGALANGVSISKCYSSCYTSGSAIASGTGKSSAYIGGIAGVNQYYNGESSGSIDSSFSTGTVQSGTVKNSYVGGLIGLNNNGGITGGSVTNSYSTCIVKSELTETDSTSVAGGLIGWNESPSVTDCYARGNVTGSSTNKACIGGLLGCNYGATSNCYATGKVSGNGKCNSGGFAGYNDSKGTIAAGYFDNQTTGQTTGVGLNANTAENSASVTGLATAEMTGTDAESKLSLDYGSKWKTQANSNSNLYYPQLKWVSGFDSVALAVYHPGDFSGPIANPGSTVLVNGETQTAGTAATTTDANGKATTTVTVDTQKLEKILDSATSGATVMIPVTGGADTASGVLTGDLVKRMESKDATLVIKTDSASYALPASEINIDKVSEQLGTSVTLSDIKVSVSIAEPSASMTQVVANATEKGKMEIVVPAVDFTISCSYNGKTVDVNSFNTYVERLIEIPSSIDPTKITTGVVVKPDGTTYHVPTQVIQKDGKYYAKINSLTNSTYTVVWHPLEFADVENHWAKSAINDMGSRMVVTGDESGKYNPDNYITRAEFAAIAVKALGLAPGLGENNFSDVSTSAWYCGYIETAAAYGIIKGYSASSFCPSDFITREQAMAMLTRAMSITGLKVSLTESDISTLIGTFKDGAAVSSYAKDSIATCLKTGIVAGTDSSAIAPKDNVTRAEVAVMLERLLKKSGLI